MNKKIILVETNLFFSGTVLGSLKRLGFEGFIETDYQRIKEKISFGICAILINLSIRNINSIELIKKLKEDSQTKSIPMIGFCGHEDTTLIESAKSAGCNLITTNRLITSQLKDILEKILVDKT